jgi:hypothetical protein
VIQKMDRKERAAAVCALLVCIPIWTGMGNSLWVVALMCAAILAVTFPVHARLLGKKLLELLRQLAQKGFSRLVG